MYHTIIEMNEKHIEEALNKAFNGNPTNFNNFKGKNNYFKVPLGQSIAYCYIDSYRSTTMLELQLITIVMHGEKDVQIFKNKLQLSQKFKAERTELDYLQIIFHPHHQEEEIALVQFQYQYKDGKRKNKLAMLTFDFQIITTNQTVILEDLITKKGVVQAQWHPSCNDYVFVLTEQSFEIVQLTQEGFLWIGATTFKTLNLGEKIVDFRFGVGLGRIGEYSLIASGESGNIHLLLCALNQMDDSQLTAEEKNIVEPLKRKMQSIVSYKTFKTQTEGDCKGIEISSPLPFNTHLLFKKVLTSGSKGRYHTIVISALIYDNTSFFEQLLLTIKGEEDSQFQIPQICMHDNKFHFWHGDKLARINLKSHISYLESKTSPEDSRLSLKQPQADVLLEVKQSTLKFLIMEYVSIKILRRAETSHNYQFIKIPVQAVTLAFEEKNATKRLQNLFAELENKLSELRKQEPINPEKSIEQRIQYLTEQGGEQETEEVCKNVDLYVKTGFDVLERQKSQLHHLFREAKQYSEQFIRHKEKWSQLDNLLNRIQHNSQIIAQMQAKNINKSDEDDKAECLKQIGDYIASRPLQILTKHRSQYQRSFSKHLDSVKQAEQTINEVQKLLDDLGLS